MSDLPTDKAKPASGEMADEVSEKFEAGYLAGWRSAKRGDAAPPAILRGLSESLGAISGMALAELSRLTAERDALKQQAQSHAMEARTANATIAEIYRLCTGAAGEPGNWNGAEPVRKLVAALSAAKAEAETLLEVVRCLRAILPEERWADDAKRMADAAIAARQGNGGDS